MEFKVGDFFRLKDEYMEYNKYNRYVHEYFSKYDLAIDAILYVTKIVNDKVYCNDFTIPSRYIQHTLYGETDENKEELQNTKRYKTGSGKQLFDVLEDDLLNYIEARGFYKANIIKYTHRYKHKGGIEDLKKVKVYVDQLIKLEEKQND